MAKSKRVIKTEIEFSRLMAGDYRMVAEEPKKKRVSRARSRRAPVKECARNEYAAFFFDACAHGQRASVADFQGAS